MKEESWFKLNKNADIKNLYNFICEELSFDQVMQLYRLLEYDINFKQNFEEIKDSD